MPAVTERGDDGAPLAAAAPPDSPLPFPSPSSSPTLAERIAAALEMLREWPWYETLRTLRERFREDRLGLTAGSLTFTTLIALVPLLTVMLALFSAFPMFGQLQGSVEKYFVQTLMPESIARPVLLALTQFTAQANRLGTVGLVVLGVTALSLVLTIDRTLNNIWRVRRVRPFGQRVLVYWAALTLGPLALGLSLTMTSYAQSASRGLFDVLPGGLSALLGAGEFMLLAVAMAGLFHYVPNTLVRWRHAWAGGLFVAVTFELAKQALAWYVASVPAYSVIYGAFATGPILLLWIYLAWVVVLLGAVIAAYAPSLMMRVRRLPATPGHRFELALVLLRELAAARLAPQRGLVPDALAERLHLDRLQIEPLLEELQRLDWVQRLDEGEAARLVLLVAPETTPLAPLVDSLLLAPGPASEPFRQRTGLRALSLADVIGPT